MEIMSHATDATDHILKTTAVIFEEIPILAHSLAARSLLLSTRLWGSFRPRVRLVATRITIPTEVLVARLVRMANWNVLLEMKEWKRRDSSDR